MSNQWCMVTFIMILEEKSAKQDLTLNVEVESIKDVNATVLAKEVK